MTCIDTNRIVAQVDCISYDGKATSTAAHETTPPQYNYTVKGYGVYAMTYAHLNISIWVSESEKRSNPPRNKILI